MGDVVGDDGEPPGEGGGANEHVLNGDRPAYGPEMGQHVAGHHGFFFEDLALDPAPEGTVIPTPDGPMTQLHDADARGEQRVSGVLAELLEQVGIGRFPDEPALDG